MAIDWSELVQTHRTLVVGIVRRIVGNDDDTEDVVQDVFWEAYRVGERQPIESWTGFLRRLATCRALDFVRARRDERPIEHDVVDEAQPGPSEIAVERELAERLRRALATLTPEESEAFCLRYFEQLSYDDVAQTLAITPNAAGLAIHRARNKLWTLFAVDREKEAR